MKFIYSFRFKLSSLYLLTILIPTVVIVVVMPYYYKEIIMLNSMNETNSLLISLERNIEAYLDDLEKLTITPYLNDDMMSALEQKYDSNHQLESPYGVLVANRALSKTLNNYMRITRNDILATMIIADDGSMYVASKDSAVSLTNYSYATQNWYNKAKRADGQAVFISSHPQDYLVNPPMSNVFSVARMIKDPDTENNLAFIMADADTNVLQKIVEGIHFHVQSSIAILDDRNQVLYSTSPFSQSTLEQIKRQQQTVKTVNDTYLVITKVLDKSNWKIVVLISNTGIQSQFTWVYIVGALFGLGGLLVTVLLFTFMSKWIMNPFRKMISLMKSVQKGKFNAQMQVRGKDEIAQLGMALNAMISHLNEMIDNEFRSKLILRNTELNLRNAEYRSLQAQLQPHFLYNVLNGFIGLNRLGQKETLEYSINSLSRMLRYILKNKDKSTIKEEFEFLRNYCELQKMRFLKKGFDFRIHCAPEAEHVLIPKLLLQPLIENSIIHGIEPINRSCMLTMTSRQYSADGALFVEIAIQDDGAGFEPALTDSSEHIGLTNVQERLRLSFPKSSFEISSQMDAGTTVTIIIPQSEEQE